MNRNESPTLGDEIRTTRDRAGRTLGQLARALDVSPALLSLVERDRRAPSRDLLVRLARELNADGDYWLGLAGTISPEAEKSLAKLARTEPHFFRRLAEYWR
jgi:transcriptional regulator with XRE-family HTH domain